MTILIPCLVISGLILVGTHIIPKFRPNDVQRAPIYDRNFIDCAPGPPRVRRSWTSFGYGPGITVYGYPSKGGTYRLDDCLGIDLDFLGLDRFNRTPHPPESDPEWQAKEDVHCARMRRLGARWIPPYDDDFRRSVMGPEDTDRYIRVGWPAGGGVWVLNITYLQAGGRGTAILYHAKDMEERCELIKRLGGEFFADPNECPHLDLS
ncbi:uncharacterized protein BO80DRAFT_351737 [Aspergillus ibericus CBS 121593]|uniref:Uncharacterized protein n=1 Tax=Aspergillus ibericus CBS 121593 TaxID=1448316 RepID=A0A395H418_9EURO|nr:hypothetical protein BO80DRAFT_351737 [Aspergillus ibericus CBS 121593]RAL02622.1 hypothetical protein BO80DRAFT_351737 [Aspergillus ibericus CBS 121593]